MNYTYPEKTVELDLWIVTRFGREPKGMEQQDVQWVALDQLHAVDFLPANKLILAEIVKLFA
jgi:8-oxo-dGTP diphosphatase